MDNQNEKLFFGGDVENPDDVFEGSVINYYDKNGKTNYLDVTRPGIPGEDRWFLSDFLKPYEGRAVLVRIEILPEEEAE